MVNQRTFVCLVSWKGSTLRIGCGVLKKGLQLIFLVAVVSSAIAVAPRSASACSCVGGLDLQERIAESEAAFVGTLIETQRSLANILRLGGDDEVIHVFEVETWIKADLGEVIEVHTPADGSSCGFEFWYEDDRVGAFLWEEGGFLHSGLCSQVDPDTLLQLVHSRRNQVGSDTTTPPLQQTDIIPIAVETPETTTTFSGSPAVEAAEEMPGDTSPLLWWLIAVAAAGTAAGVFAYARATRSSNSSSK